MLLLTFLLLLLLLLLLQAYLLGRDHVCLPGRVGRRDGIFEIGMPPAQLLPIRQAVLWWVEAQRRKQLLLRKLCNSGSAQAGVST